jgi:beta-glucanase (GH16 family)
MIKFNEAIVLIFLFAACTSVHGQQKESANNKNSSSPVIFFEDFSGKSLDRSKWNVIGPDFHVNNEQQAYVDSSSIIYLAKGKEVDGAENGALVIKPMYSPGFVNPNGTRFDFLSGRIDTSTKVEFTYGTAAARIKMPAGDGYWPAFWALGNGEWPDTGEIDIMEYVGERDWVGVALHGPGYSGDTPLVNKFYFKDGVDVTQWHVYSVDWTKDALLFRVDGQLVYRATRPMIENYGKWAFDNPKYIIVNFALGGAYPAKTNGVKEPYSGIPQSTVDMIKQGKAKFIVDWVKITKGV